jgi:hypothetical protein
MEFDGLRRGSVVRSYNYRRHSAMRYCDELERHGRSDAAAFKFRKCEVSNFDFASRG